MNEGSDRRKRGWLIPAVAIAVVIALTVVALVREPVQLDPASPEGVVQGYLQSIADEDYERAHALLSAELQAECAPADLADEIYYETFTATLGDVTEIGNEVLVEATIRYGSDPGFLDPGYSFTPEPFRLTMEDGDWVIGSDPWPFFTYGCNNQ